MVLASSFGGDGLLGLHRGNIGILGLHRGYIGDIIMENIMETTIVYWGYNGVILWSWSA